MDYRTKLVIDKEINNCDELIELQAIIANIELYMHKYVGDKFNTNRELKEVYKQIDYDFSKIAPTVYKGDINPSNIHLFNGIKNYVLELYKMKKKEIIGG